MDDLRSMFRRDQCAMVTPWDLVVYMVGWVTLLYLALALAFAAMGVL